MPKSVYFEIVPAILAVLNMSNHLKANRKRST